MMIRPNTGGKNCFGYFKYVTMTEIEPDILINEVTITHSPSF